MVAEEAALKKAAEKDSATKSKTPEKLPTAP